MRAKVAAKKKTARPPSRSTGQIKKTRRAKALPPEPLATPASPEWPAQLDTVAKTVRTALRSCNKDQAVAVAEFMVDAGMDILSSASGHDLMLIAQDAPMHRLLKAISAYAWHTGQPVDDTVTALILKLGPNAVSQDQLN